MIKNTNSTLIRWPAAILALLVAMTGLSGPAYSQQPKSALLLQQTPAQGGTVTPDTGVHHFGLNTQVTLTAIAKPGYHFVYWLGDVSDPTAESTVVYLDVPKIVIAVFELAEYDEILDVYYAGAQSAPIGGLIASPADYSRGGGGGGGGRRPDDGTTTPSQEPPPDDDVPGDLPVPEGKDDFPVPEPVPEPATAILLAMGSLFALTRRRLGKEASAGAVLNKELK